MNKHSQELNLDLFFETDIIIEEPISQKENRFYNYIYLDPRKAGRYCYDGLNFSLLYEPFYVGKGTGNRYKVHMSEKKTCNQTKNDYIKSLKEERLKPIIILLNFTKDEQKSYITENNIIDSIKCIFDGGTLTNKISHYPLNCTEELRKSYGSPKEKHPLWQIGHSDEAKKKIGNRDYSKQSGEFSYLTKHYHIINNLGEVFRFKDSLRKFCDEHNLSYANAINYINKGKVTKIRNRSYYNRTSLLGWEIIRLD